MPIVQQTKGQMKQDLFHGLCAIGHGLRRPSVHTALPPEPRAPNDLLQKTLRVLEQPTQGRVMFLGFQRILRGRRWPRFGMLAAKMAWALSFTFRQRHSADNQPSDIPVPSCRFTAGGKDSRPLIQAWESRKCNLPRSLNIWSIHRICCYSQLINYRWKWFLLLRERRCAHVFFFRKKIEFRLTRL